MLARTGHATRVSEYGRFTVAEDDVRSSMLSQRVLPHVAEILAVTLDEHALLFAERVALTVYAYESNRVRAVSSFWSKRVSVYNNGFKHREALRADRSLERLKHTLTTILFHHHGRVGIYCL